MATFDDIVTELTAPATGDKLLVRDISDASYKDKFMTLAKLAVLSLANTFAALATFSAGLASDTIKAASAAGLSLQDDGGNQGAKVLDGGVLQVGNLTFDQHVAIADDGVFSFSPSGTWGLMFVFCPTSMTPSALVFWRVTATNNGCALIQPGSDVVATTGALTGTTGTDGKFTISAHTDGKIYMENRLGGAKDTRYLVITAT